MVLSTTPWKRCITVLVSILLVSGLVFSPGAAASACGVAPGGCHCPGC